MKQISEGKSWATLGRLFKKMGKKRSWGGGLGDFSRTEFLSKREPVQKKIYIFIPPLGGRPAFASTSALSLRSFFAQIPQFLGFSQLCFLHWATFSLLFTPLREERKKRRC